MPQDMNCLAPLLDGRYIVSLATLNRDTSIHLVAVWFISENGNLFVPTSSKSRKARNVLVRPQASIMVDARRDDSQRGLSVSGRAEIITGDSARALNLRIHNRYLTPGALANPRVGPVMLANDDVTIRLIPEKWAQWDLNEDDQKVFEGDLFGSAQGSLLPLD